MANQKILDHKKEVVSEIEDKIKNSKALVVVEYNGLTVDDTNELRRSLRNSDAELKVYKNTLVKKALTDLNIDLGKEFEGPKAIAFGADEIGPAKVIAEFAKTHPAVEMKVGYIGGKVADKELLDEYASIPSREGLLTMIAGGLLENVKNIAICIDLYSQKLEK